MIMQQDDVLTITQTAERLNLTRRYVGMLVHKGDKRFDGAYLQGSSWLIPKRIVDGFVRGTGGRPKMVR